MFEAENVIFPILLLSVSIGLIFGTGGGAIISAEQGRENRKKACEYLSLFTSVLSKYDDSVSKILQEVKKQVGEGIAHSSYDYFVEHDSPFLNDPMEVNLQLAINGDELDTLAPEFLDLDDSYTKAGARLELELLENEYGDGGYDSEMEYMKNLYDEDNIHSFHDLYIKVLESIINIKVL